MPTEDVASQRAWLDMGASNLMFALPGALRGQTIPCVQGKDDLHLPFEKYPSGEWIGAPEWRQKQVRMLSYTSGEMMLPGTRWGWVGKAID